MDAINSEFQEFIGTLGEALKKLNLSIGDYPIDHVCYRVETMEEYKFFYSKFSSLGELLVASQVGGREIATFKLKEPLRFQKESLEIYIVELPSPKIGSSYKKGFEHVEFVIRESFEDFSKKHLSLRFDWEGTKKKINPELRLALTDNLNVKFHHQSLEEVIEYEKRHGLA